MECTVRWTGEGMTFLAETGSNHVVAMDGAPEGGGRNLAPRPMEVVLAGTGGCTAYDVVVILKKSGQTVSGLRSNTGLILAGVAIAAFFNSIQMYVQQSQTGSLRQVYSWILGRRRSQHTITTR